MYPYFSICSSKLFQFGYLHACSSTPLGCPDLLNLNPSILTLSLYSTLLLSMTSSWFFLLEIGITANLFMLDLIFYSLSFWFCFSTFLWDMRVSVRLYCPVLLALSVVLSCLVLVLECHWYRESRVLVLVLILVVLHSLSQMLVLHGCLLLSLMSSVTER